MNDLLNQFASQASREYLTTLDQSSSVSQKTAGNIVQLARDAGVLVIPDIVFEKFAELVIKECARRAVDHILSSTGQSFGTDTVILDSFKPVN
jgi:hypothetical protein